MKTHTLTICAFLVVAMVSFAGNARAASVTAETGYFNAFDVQPSAAVWATFSRAGGAGDNYDTDTDVNANITASGVTAQTTLSAIDPPAANWHRDLEFQRVLSSDPADGQPLHGPDGEVRERYGHQCDRNHPLLSFHHRGGPHS